MSLRWIKGVLERGPSWATGQLVMLVLAERADDDTGACWPSYNDIASRTRAGRSTVIRALARLEREGFITCIKGGGRGNANLYRLSRALLSTSCGEEETVSERHPNTAETVSERHERVSERHERVSERHPNHIEPSRTKRAAAARAREEPAAAAAEAEQPKGDQPETERERLLEAMGADPVSGLTGPNGRMIGTAIDMARAKRWRDELGLTLDEQIAVIRDIRARQRRKDPGWVPRSFAYFDGAMAELAKAKKNPVMDKSVPGAAAAEEAHKRENWRRIAEGKQPIERISDEEDRRRQAYWRSILERYPEPTVTDPEEIRQLQERCRLKAAGKTHW